MSKLWQISVTVPLEAEEAVAELFRRHFGEFPSIYTAQKTGKSRVAVYRVAAHPMAATQCQGLAVGLKAIVRGGMALGPGRLSLKKIRRENWAESWKRHFPPIHVGSALLIKPTWSRRHPRKNQVAVVLDPGLSFGTGHHPTTGFCLRQIVACRKLGQTRAFLDMGSGSGILAIAAAKLGYCPVEAFDFDPAAVKVALANAHENGVAKLIRFRHQEVGRLSFTPRRRFDVIGANLEFPILIEECRRILAHLAPAGTLILAGILVSQFDRLESVYRQAGLRLKTGRTEGEWRSGAFVCSP